MFQLYEAGREKVFQESSRKVRRFEKEREALVKKRKDFLDVILKDYFVLINCNLKTKLVILLDMRCS